MPKLLGRFMLIFALLGSTPVLYIVLYSILEDTLLPIDEYALLVTNLIVGSLLSAAWIYAWYQVVPWTPRRRWLTVLSIFWSVLAAIPVGIVVAIVTRDDEVAIVLGGLSWFVIWVMSVTLVWAETPVERARRVAAHVPQVIRCLKCGYNMSGLQQTRCPECGAQYTIDEMVAAAYPADDPWG